MAIIYTALVIIISLAGLPVIAKDAGIHSWKQCLIIYIVLVTANLTVFFVSYDQADILALINSFVSLFFAVWLSVEDIVKHQLPNRILAAWLIIRVPLVLISLVTERSLSVVIDSIFGAVVVGALLLVIHILSKSALGSGDVKLGFAIGFAFALKTAFFAVVTGFLICALYAVFRLLLRSKKSKAALPLGPFMFAGIIVACIFT